MAKASRSASVSGRTGAFAAYAAKAMRASLGAARYAKWPAVLVAGIVVARHPSLVGDLLGGLADLLGWPRLLVQWLGWTLVLLPALYLASWVWRLLGFVPQRLPRLRASGV